MEVYTKEIELTEELSTTGLFKILQDVSAEHCEMLGLGMDYLSTKGLIWVVARHYVKAMEWPEKGEKLRITTWPGKTKHVMFPRFYIIRDSRGEKIIEGSAIWTLVNMESRKLAAPKDYSINFDGEVTGEECRLPGTAKKIQTTESTSFVVPKEYMDSNLHMNNTRYYEMSENCFKSLIAGKHLYEVTTDYVSEALIGEEIKLFWGEEEGRIYITGENDGTVFKMNLEYK